MATRILAAAIRNINNLLDTTKETEILKKVYFPYRVLKLMLYDNMHTMRWNREKGQYDFFLSLAQLFKKIVKDGNNDRNYIK